MRSSTPRWRCPRFSETVETASPQAAEFAQTVRALGVAIAPRRVALRNELPGYITAVNYRSGARVAQGKVILQLDVSEASRTSRFSANARAELAQVIHDRDSGSTGFERCESGER